jgi:hypothetical protein
VFPITSKAPGSGTLALEIPETEARRAGLPRQCWIVVEEYNRINEDELYDFESLDPLGAFGLGFLKKAVSRS